MGCLKLEEKGGALRVVYKKDTALMLTQRGYTGHEHFYEQDIIHMNGRIYDPKLRMFLSPDINLLDPSDSKHYNRYSYALNNPLMYSDPSGDEIITLAALGTAALVGAIIGGISYTALACYYGNFTWNNLAKNVVTSAVTSAVMATGMGILKDLFLFPQGGATALSRANEAMSNGVSNLLGDTGHSIAQAGVQGAAFTGYTAASIMNNSINTSASFASYSNNANLYNASNFEISIIDNDYQAIRHYFRGNGNPVQLGPNTEKALLDNNDFIVKHNRITSGQTTSMKGDFSVNMRKDVFHVNRTNVNYSIKCASKSCSVTYELFANDGFWDVDFIDEHTLGNVPYVNEWTNTIPDGMGPNLERLGGSPYPYIPKTRVFSFPKPITYK